MDINNLTPTELEKIKSERVTRRILAQKSHLWFFSIYLNHYMEHAFAPFHYEMFQTTEDTNQKLSVTVAFRGSGKSTLMTTSYPIWAAVGVQQKKLILIISQTQSQARTHLANLKKELEANQLLKDDIGPFRETSDEWGAQSIVLSDWDARIVAVSTEQSIRGIRNGQYRPDLIICDDIEDLMSVKTKEGRERTFQWFNGEVAPIGDRNTKIVVVGNLLHEDSLIMRLKKLIYEEKLDGSFYSYPLLDDDGNISWLGKYPTMKEIEELKRTIGSDSAFFREYLLRIISDADRVVHPDWILSSALFRDHFL